MLYYLNIGDTEKRNAPWETITDEHENNFYAKDDIRQRIRLDRNIKIDKKGLNEIQTVKSEEGVRLTGTIYSLPDYVKWVNNNKNMNPMLIHISKGMKPNDAHHIVYITVSAEYKILSYKTDHRILQTYHAKDSYQGCAVIFNEAERAKNDVVMSINLLDTKTNEFKNIDIAIDSNLSLLVQENEIDDAALETLKKKAKKYTSSYLGFRIITGKKEMLTCTYLVSPKMKEKAEELAKNIKNAHIIELDQDTIKDEAKLKEVLDEILLKERIRTVTLLDVVLPPITYKNYRLLYIFNYDVKTETLVCRKSN